MATKIGIGFSDNLNPEIAAKDAAFLSKTNLNEDAIHLVIVFSTPHYQPEKILPIFSKILNTNKIIGSSTAGIILPNATKTKGVAVMTIHSDEIDFGMGLVDNLKNLDSFQAGILLAKNTLNNYKSQGRQAILYFSDTQIADYSNFLKGIQSVLGNIFPIIGAGCSDNFRFKDTFQFYENNIFHNAAVGIILGGQVSIGLGSRHGWKPLGKPRYVDQSENNVIKMIDGKKACHIYQEFLGQDSNKLLSNQTNTESLFYPLGVYLDHGKEYLLKNTLGVLPDGSIISHGHVPAGSRIHMMIGNKDSCLQAASDAAQEAYKNLKGKEPKFLLVIDSMTRLKLLSRSAVQELNKIKEVFGSSIPIIGMYSNGEVSPYKSQERFNNTFMQNESIIIMAIS